MKQNSDNNNCKIYRFENETGQGTITSYEVFPGVLLAFNDFHMSYYDSAFQPRQDVFCIDHCREGRLEYPLGKDAYSYVEAGDLKLDRRLTHVEHFEMPEVPEEKPYFYKTQVEKIKAMKQCFKSVYGMPIGAWMLQYRMNYAAEQLHSDTQISIADLAGGLGYDSQSKFAMAFRKVMGMSPTEYRRQMKNPLP